MSDALQDHYPPDFAHCYGCGYRNEHGWHIKSRWEGDEVVCHFQPRPEYIAFPGFAYGGMIASVIDCHSMGTASLAWMRERGMTPGDDVPAERFVTASLKIDYLKPTPMGGELVVRARATEIGERKVVVDAELYAGGEITARGHTIAVRAPETVGPKA